MADSAKLTVYIVLAVDWYGGGTKTIRAFRDQNDAQSYAEITGASLGLDIRVLKAEVAENVADAKTTPKDVTE